MPQSTVIDVAIGLMLVYLTFSLFCSALNEWIARFLALRASGLRNGLSELFDKDNFGAFVDAFHAHPLIDALKPSKAPVLRRITEEQSTSARYPSYLSAKTFALTVMDLATNATSPGRPGIAVRAMLKNPAHADTIPLPPAIRTLLADVEGDAAAMQKRLEEWFDESMDRVSGWYKRRTQVTLAVMGLVVALAFNLDTLRLVHQLSTEPTVREAMVQQAAIIVAKANKDSINLGEVKQRIDALQQTGLRFGWDASCSPVPRLLNFGPAASTTNCGSPFATIVGVLITAMALSFGAPFWFDALNKIVNFRQAGAPPETSKKK